MKTIMYILVYCAIIHSRPVETHGVPLAKCLVFFFRGRPTAIGSNNVCLPTDTFALTALLGAAFTHTHTHILFCTMVPAR